MGTGLTSSNYVAENYMSARLARNRIETGEVKAFSLTNPVTRERGLPVAVSAALGFLGAALAAMFGYIIAHKLRLPQRD